MSVSKGGGCGRASGLGTGRLPKNIQKRYTDFWPLRKCLEIYSKEVHRLLAVTPRKSLHPSKQNFARRLRRRLTPDSSQRHYETARKLVLCSRALRTSTSLERSAPRSFIGTPLIFTFFLDLRGVLGIPRGVNRRDPQMYSKELYRLCRLPSRVERARP